MADAIYIKTSKGQEEIKTRAHGLDTRYRALLLLINGERRASELLGLVGVLGMDQGTLDMLRDDGYVAEVAAAAPEAASEPQTRTLVQETTPGELQADGYRHLYRVYTELIGQHLGLRGYMLQVKVEKAANVAELAGLRETVYQALKKAKGDVTADVVIAQVDRAIRAGGGLS
jgi:hypothetical protein